MKIGFIGLGNMGAPMAANLAKAGHEVTGFDMADVSVDGVTIATSGPEAAKGADVVITMLPTAKSYATSRRTDPSDDKRRDVGRLLDCRRRSARAVADQAQAAGILAVTHQYPAVLAGRPAAH